MDINYQLI